MDKLHTSGWASDSPTPAQIKEFLAQCDPKRNDYITGTRLQEFLRGGKIERLASEAVCSPFFATEEVKSNYGYPSGYAAKPVGWQMEILKRVFQDNLDVKRYRP